jgi:hypothetical protein
VDGYHPEKAGEWIRTLSSSTKDDVLVTVVHRSRYPDNGSSPEEKAAHFEKTARWIPEIIDPQKRDAAYRDLDTRWMYYHPESGRRWLDSIPISSDAKSQVLKAAAE